MIRAVALVCAAQALHAQSPIFEVASVKVNRSGGGGSSIRGSAARLTMENVPLKKATLWAYGIPDDREYALVGPDWLTTERYDIEATFPGDTRADVRKMMQALLAQRFKLQLHRETRQMPIYALVVAKGGPKIHPVEIAQNRTSGAVGRLDAYGITIQKLADLLARLAGAQVVDATELKGTFDFTLQWVPDESLKGPVVGDGSSGPSIYTALQEQLGLKLESRKGPVEVLVVDHVEKTPTEN